MRFFPILLLILLIQLSALAQTLPYTTVFESGTEGHQSYRIPSIIQSPSGKLLAICEGRVHHAGDYGDINLVLKTSSDNGKTWSPLQTIVDYADKQAGNPAPVVDRTDPRYPQGRIFLFYNTGNNHEWEVRNGQGYREVWYITSTDEGKTWSEPVNITTQVHRPNMPEVRPEYKFQEDWRSYANTPGHALQFQDGRYKGRIYVAANHSGGKPQDQFKDYQAHGFYTDDHGATFHLSENISYPGSNEAMAAQLKGDRLVMNIRNQQGDVRARLIATSSNGGKSWDTSYFDLRLPDPVCQGSLLSVGNTKNRKLLFINNADSLHRNNLVLRISKDDGKTWYKEITIARKDSVKPNESYSAYSDLVAVRRKQVGILYELEEYSKIVFVRVKY
jgi:sialidase-1